LRHGSSAPAWHKKIVETKNASLTASVGSAVAQSLSYAMIPEFGSLDKQFALQDWVLRQSQTQDLLLLFRFSFCLFASKFSFSLCQ
jgi:hypothetical protein